MVLRASARWAILCVLLAGGCESEHFAPATAAPVDWFAATQVRIHPIFTQVADWTHSGKPDGIEAQLEFTDQFNDPTKASGHVLFELFDYRRDTPEPRGKRIAYWVGSLASLDEQRARWNTTLRTYRFQLVEGSIQADKAYVLNATFEQSAGGRFPVSSIILPARLPESKNRKSGSLEQELNGRVGTPTTDSTQP